MTCLNLAPFCYENLAQGSPKTPQDAPRTPQDTPRRGKNGSQKLSEAQSPPDLDFGAFWAGFGSVFGRILERFRVDLGGQKEQDRYTEGHREPQRATEFLGLILEIVQGWSGLFWSGLLWSSLGASAASEASEAIRLFHMLQDCPSLREIFNRKSMLANIFSLRHL